jgi:lipopolysaccharide/colanic/teichoic acid biosynthesis glycosyltransferase
MNRLLVRPGLTGLWQVSGRSEIVDFEEVVRLDQRYIDDFSLGLDLRILARTIPAVINRRGAY